MRQQGTPANEEATGNRVMAAGEQVMSETLAQLFRHTVAYDKTNAILAKADGEYRPISSQELYRRVARLHAELNKAGIGKGDRCALLSENRWEWAVADFAMMTAGIVSVPLYPTLTNEQIHYLLEHSEAKVVMVSTFGQLEKIQAAWDRLPKLEGVIIFDDYTSDDERVIGIETLIGNHALSNDEKQAFEASISAVESQDLASLIYTSGTTGVPKGVMLSHGNFTSNVKDCGFDVRENDVCLSFLPLCHVAERTSDYIFFYNGSTLAYAESIDKVPVNMMEVRPTLALGVPRFFEKVHGRVIEKMGAAPPLRQKLFHWAVGVGKETPHYLLEGRALPIGLRVRHAVADRLVLSKLRGRLGGRFRYFVSGAAPLARHLAEFFYAVGIPICEAYGLTETSPIVSGNLLDEMRFGTVGKVIKNVEVKIAADGEIMVRGPNVMQGYYKMEKQTSEVIVDGWFLTGDIGELSADGYLKITDRKKDLFKTSGGKYIAPQPIENQLKASAYISTAVVVAEARKFPSALVIPNFEKLRQYAAANDLELAGDKELCRHEKIIELLELEVQEACKGMPRYEQVKKIAVLDQEFSIEKGEITPTMKVRRREVEKIYAEQIEKIYAEPRP